jgi:hypothetical protein
MLLISETDKTRNAKPDANFPARNRRAATGNLSAHVHHQRVVLDRQHQGFVFAENQPAVGPFSTLRGGNLREEYNRLMDNTRPFIERLLAFHRANVEHYRILDEQHGEVM